jgi:hypothetical protein
VNAPETLRRFEAATASLQRAETWAAWRLGERESLPIDLGQPETLDDALMAAMGRVTDSGQVIAIQRSHAGRGKHTLWQFRVTRSTKKGTWRAATDGGRPVFVGKLEPKLLCEVALAAPFAPVLPFDAFRDDPVGNDPQIVNAEWGEA